CLDPEAMTRFSDIDAVFLLAGPLGRPIVAGTCAAASQLSVGGLKINVDILDGLSRRAPLLACRLLAEQLPIIGRLDQTNLPRPRAQDIQAEARYWSQNAAAALWTRATDSRLERSDPILLAWMASKYSLDALGFHLLLSGRIDTHARAVMRFAEEAREARWS